MRSCFLPGARPRPIWLPFDAHSTDIVGRIDSQKFFNFLVDTPSSLPHSTRMNLFDSLSHFFSLLGSEFAQIGVKETMLILSILIMDAALSGDNSIAISALAMGLPKAQQNKVVWAGMGLAAALRVVALCCASFIMSNPWVQMLGALYLIKLCWDHFRKGGDEGGDSHAKQRTLVGTLIAIGFLDLSLSLDNVIAVVAMTSNLAVIMIGVLASIAMLAVATQVTRLLMKRYPSLEHAAYIILAFLGVVMLCEHTSEFLIWSSVFIASHETFIKTLTLHIGDTGEIIGVAAIVGLAVLLDEIKKRREKAATA